MARLFPANNFVPPRFGTGLRLAIAEAPGEQEAIEGEPLVGQAGKWLRGLKDNDSRHGGLYGKAGIRDEEVTFLNIIQCRPPENNFPTDATARSYISETEAGVAVQRCVENHVLPVLVGRPWKRIDLLGDKALRHLTGRIGISKWRGSPLPVIGIDKPIAVGTMHPAAIARDQTLIPAVISDLKKSLIIPPENYNIAPTLDEVRAFTATTFAFDIENDPVTEEISIVGLSGTLFSAIVVPFKGEYKSELKRIFANAKEIIGHNCIQHDIRILKDNDIPIDENATIVWDTMLMQHLLQPDLPHSLEFVASIFTNKPYWKDDKTVLETYCARDTDAAFQIWLQLKALLRHERLMDVYQYVQVPLARICRLMHKTGFKINPNRIEEVRARLKEEMTSEESYLPEHLKTHTITVRKRTAAPPGTLSPKTGKPVKTIAIEVQEYVVPWRKSEAIAQYLYEELGLPVQLHPKTKRVTTDKYALERLFRKTKRREIQAIMRLRAMDELETTFCKEEMLQVDRIYPNFNVHGTASGRLSSSEPNLQNVPNSARFIYVPSYPGWKIVEFDYSQIENRLTAFFARDSDRLGRFLSDAEFSEHRWVASQFFNLPYAEIVKDNDRDAPYGKAKRINHGCNYGMGPQKITNLYDMPLPEVRELVAKWKQINHITVKWQEFCAKEAKNTGYLTTPFNRKRWFWTTSYWTEALSFLPQSTAADIIFRAMLGLMCKKIDWPHASSITKVAKPIPDEARLLLQVHDSLVFECPSEIVDSLIAVVKPVMEQPWPELAGFSIPVEVKVSSSSWGEMETYHVS